MNRTDVGTVFRKEIIDLLRDRRSVIASIVLPVILFPVLMFGSNRLEEMRERELEEEEMSFALEGSMEAFEDLLGEDILLKRVEVDDLTQALTDDEIQAGIILPDHLPLPGEPTADLAILFNESSDRSRVARDRVVDHVSEWREMLQQDRLEALGASDGIIAVLDRVEINIASAEKMAGGRLGAGIPILIVFLLINGASYVAVDLFSGEKERKTIETLLTSVVDRRSVVAGKFLAVFTMAQASTLLLIISNLLYSILGLTGEAGRNSLTISPGTALMVIAVTFPLGIFVSAALVYLASHAKSYREAQTLMLPVTLVAILPAVLGILPGTRLESIICIVPITNVAVAIREGLVGNYPVFPLIMVVVSNLVYAAWVLSMATRFLESEALILGRAAGPTLIRGERSLVRPVILFYFAELLALYYIGAAIQAENLMGGLLITLWVLLLIPSIIFAHWNRIPWKRAFAMNRPSLSSLLGAILIAPATLLLANAAFQLQSQFVPLPEELFGELEGLLGGEEGGILLALFAVAISPGFCEEMLFRGLILGRLRKGMTSWRAVVLGGLLFGLFHLSIYRILPTALMGMAAGALVLLSGSIFPAMTLHAVYNGIVVLSSHFEILEGLDQFDFEIVGGALLLAGVGIWLVFRDWKARFNPYSS